MRTLFGLILYIGLAVYPLCGRAESLPDLIDTLRPSIVGVGSFRPARGSKQPPVKFRGTGFVVGNGREVITNYHVLPKQLDTENNENLAIFVGRGRKGRAIRARVRHSDPDHDLVLLEIDESLPPMTLSNSSLVREGTDIAFIGYPIGVVLGLFPVTHRGIISARTPIVIPGIKASNLTAQQVKRIRDPFEVYQLDATAYPGNSGSPVFDRDSGRVIGVINSVFVKGTKESVLEKPSGISYAIPVRYVNELLQRKGSPQSQ